MAGKLGKNIYASLKNAFREIYTKMFFLKRISPFFQCQESTLLLLSSLYSAGLYVLLSVLTFPSGIQGTVALSLFRPSFFPLRWAFCYAYVLCEAIFQSTEQFLLQKTTRYSQNHYRLIQMTSHVIQQRKKAGKIVPPGLVISYLRRGYFGSLAARALRSQSYHSSMPSPLRADRGRTLMSGFRVVACLAALSRSKST